MFWLSKYFFSSMNNSHSVRISESADYLPRNQQSVVLAPNRIKPHISVYVDRELFITNEERPNWNFSFDYYGELGELVTFR